MPKKFISNGELRTLLAKATEEERFESLNFLNKKKENELFSDW